MIGIVCIGNIKYSPYLEKYVKILEDEQKEYEVLFWSRDNSDNLYPDNFICFDKNSDLGQHGIIKSVRFLQYGLWLKNIIGFKKYDGLIILTTLSGIILWSTILMKYKDKYIFDIRDYSYEKYKLFFHLEEKIIKYSMFTCISSIGFKEFLPPKYDYVIAHNFNYNDLNLRKAFKKKPKGSVINLVWNGIVRYFDHQSAIIDRLKNDSRFNIIYHGSGPELDKFKKYCSDNKINNVFFTGAYDNNTKYLLLNDADILNNSYAIKNEVKYAISNKYYDGVIYAIPQLVEVNSFKHKKVSELGIGIGLDVHNNGFANQLYDYYFDINAIDFNESCNKELQSILKEDEVYLKKISEFVLE
jgi:hypothetical protein